MSSAIELSKSGIAYPKMWSIQKMSSTSKKKLDSFRKTQTLLCDNYNAEITTSTNNAA